MRSIRLRICPSALAVGLFFTASGAVFAQDLPPLSGKYAPGTLPGGGGMSIRTFPVVTGKPFHAEVNVRTVRTAPNGTRTTYEYHGFAARDSQGRILQENQESPRFPTPGNPGDTSYLPNATTVKDTVTGVVMHWDDATRAVFQAYRPVDLMRDLPLDGCVGFRAGAPNVMNTKNRRLEDLGTRMIDGIPAVGCRTTLFFAAIKDVPNSKDSTVTDETWSSPDLGVTLRHLRSDELNGNDVTEAQLDHVVRGEPDAARFEPPKNHAVRDLDAEIKRVKEERIPFNSDWPQPAMIAGPWEMEDPILGKDTHVGIFLETGTSFGSQSDQGRAAGEYSGTIYGPMKINYYQRKSGEEQKFEFNPSHANVYFSSTWDGHRLEARYAEGEPSGKLFVGGDFALDLTFDQKQKAWIGTYWREGHTKQVRLERPGQSVNSAASPFVGTWTAPVVQRGRGIPGASCMNIVRGTDGAFMAWDTSSRNLVVNGNRFLANGGGKRWSITVLGDTVTLDATDYMAGSGGGIGGRAKFVGELSPDGKQIVGRYVASGVAPPGRPQEDGPAVVMTRISEDSCTARFPEGQTARQSGQ